ncbi:hypothetical protein SFRURICE_020565 [Spodoptera frugiperda]|nr:hypothetical protein SFRURICE_020565 [Spodoptera frugiperda]
MKGSRGGGTFIFPLWKRLTFKRLILKKNGFRNLNVFFKDLSIDTHQEIVTQNGEIKLPREDRHQRGRSRGRKLVRIIKMYENCEKYIFSGMSKKLTWLHVQSD